MSLIVLASIVVFGIAAVVIAVHWSGGGRAGQFERIEDAFSVFKADHPETEILEGRLTQGREAAFLRLAQGDRIGFVQVFGRHFLTREIGPDDLISPVRLDHAAIVLATRDFTWKGGRYVFADTATAAEVAAWCPAPRKGTPRLHLSGTRHG